MKFWECELTKYIKLSTETVSSGYKGFLFLEVVEKPIELWFRKSFSWFVSALSNRIGAQIRFKVFG